MHSPSWLCNHHFCANIMKLFPQLLGLQVHFWVIIDLIIITAGLILMIKPRPQLSESLHLLVELTRLDEVVDVVVLILHVGEERLCPQHWLTVSHWADTRYWPVVERSQHLSLLCHQCLLSHCSLSPPSHSTSTHQHQHQYLKYKVLTDNIISSMREWCVWDD